MFGNTSLASRKQRDVCVTQVDARNRALGAKLKNVHGEIKIRREKVPKHCHAAARRKKGERERRAENAKIRKALEGIYKSKRSRLENFGVTGRDFSDQFAARTALYDDDRRRFAAKNEFWLPEAASSRKAAAPRAPRAAWADPDKKPDKGASAEAGPVSAHVAVAQ